MTSARLLSFSIVPRLPGGLELRTRYFGDFLTLVCAENRAGKTAVMCSLYWALGGARQPEEPIWSECFGVELILVDVRGRIVRIKRAFEKNLRATILSADGLGVSYNDEASFSSEVRTLLGIPGPEWSGRNGGVVPAYMSLVLPAIAVDQDKGWTLPYVPFSSRSFVKDQAEEVGRLMLGLDARHNAARDRLLERMLSRRAELRERVAVQDRAIDALNTQAFKSDGRSLAELRRARDALQVELGSFDQTLAAFAEADVVLKNRLLQARSRHDATRRELANARQRVASLDRLMHETEADVHIIGSNETAAQAFRLFCANPSCGFFLGDTEQLSYGRRVLYLRDQLKDLRTAMLSADSDVVLLEERLANETAELTLLRREYEVLSTAGPSARLAGAVDSLAVDLAKVAGSIAMTEQIVAVQGSRGEVVASMELLERDIHDHRAGAGRRTDEVRQVGLHLQIALRRWLMVLRADGVEKVEVTKSLRIAVDGKPLADLRGPSGSSRLRLILAYHAARLEVALERSDTQPAFLLFDAPKQHELNPEDFELYLAELRLLAGRFPGRVQIVLSSRTAVSLDDGDTEWTAEFPGEKHPWFLGRPVSHDEAP